MRKLCFVLTALLLTAPAFAAMTITCAQVGVTDEVAISYAMDGGDANLPRGFGLDISVDSGATIDDISYTDPCFWIYPGTIVIVDGNITNPGSPVAPDADPGAQGQLGTSAITVEMGSLYHPDDANHATAPASSGVLLTIVVSADCNVVVAGNSARGNVVLENTDEASVNYGSDCNIVLTSRDICPFTVGMVIGGDTITQAMRTMWEGLTDNQKKVWCNECFSWGDTNNDCVIDYGNDVTTLKIAYSGAYNPTADFNKDGAIDYGNDVTRLKTHYNTGCQGTCVPVP
jgi:hypothetical protein